MSTELVDRWISPEQLVGLEPLELLGEGSGGRVHLCRGPGGESLALKIAHSGREESGALEPLLLFLAEGPGLPRLHGVGLIDERPAFAMELVRGSLFDQVGSSEDLEALGWRALRVVGGALDRLHRLGFAHGDVKPENLAFNEASGPVLIDLGLAARIGTPTTGGTPAYLETEGLEVGAARDTFALALSLAELLDPSLRERTDVGRGCDASLPPSLASVLAPLLSGEPGTRPGLDWLLQETRRQGEECQPAGRLEGDENGGEGDELPWLQARLRTAYLGLRLPELARRPASNVEVTGLPGRWLMQLGQVLQQVGRFLRPDALGLVVLDAEPGSRASESTSNVTSLKPHDRARLVFDVVGSSASGVVVPAARDDDLLQRLSRALSRFPWGGLPPAALAAAGAIDAEPLPPLDEWGLRLGRWPIDGRLIRAIEEATRCGEVPEPLRREGAKVLRRQGELRRARELLNGTLDRNRESASERDPTESAHGLDSESTLELAIVARRMGHPDQSRNLLEKLVAHTDDGQPRCVRVSVVSQAWAGLARTVFDEGAVAEALDMVTPAPASAARSEVCALCLIALSRFDEARDELAIGRSLVSDEEQLSRLEGMSGYLEHQLGHADIAYEAFRRAVWHASRVGAVLEEATYQTGAASTASDAGLLARALDASRRSELLFRSLGQPVAAARAVLGEASVLSLLGATPPLLQSVERGLALARAGGDTRCEGYLQLCLADGRVGEAGGTAARAAWTLMEDAGQEDQLRAAARLEAHGILPSLGLSFDPEVVASECTSREPRIDWWAARARRLLGNVSSSTTPSSASGADGALGIREAALEVVEQIAALAAEGLDAIVLGPALVDAASLAVLAGAPKRASPLLSQARRLADRLIEGCAGDHQERARGLEWVQKAQAPVGGGFEPEQLSEVESLLRALSQRGSLKELLRQILDLLLLWTGVERGLILLTAPGDRLVVRAARNLSDGDLEGPHLELSHSMARRAMREGRPVVAVDAIRDGSEVSRSVHALKLRSVLAVPLSAHGRLHGVAYLDDRVRRGAFGEKELAWVSLIGTVAALALSEERDRLNLRRAARRAQAAERRVTEQLDQARGELELAERRLEGREALHGNYPKIVGQSGAMTSVLRLVDRVAKTDVPVLITGESGTGKELIARAIVDNGDRAKTPFVIENCGAVPETLLESTLFGHRRGAFTGASRDRKGLFELAHGGTLFLDEIGEMSLAMQTKLLRVLQEGVIRPVGAEREIQVDVRVVAATHRDLSTWVKEERFREDLYYRLSVVAIEVPPLRERPEDVDALVDHFLRLHDPRGERTLSKSARDRMRAYGWPGNVRQLENEVRRMLVLGEQNLVVSDLGNELQGASDLAPARTLREKLDVLERHLIIEALDENHGNRTKAAEVLGVSRYGLQKMMVRLGVASGASAKRS